MVSFVYVFLSFVAYLDSVYLFTDSPAFHLSATGEDMFIHDITIFQPLPVYGTTDGISLSCKRCLVERIKVQNGDDCVVFKTPSSDSLVRNISCRYGGGVGLGTVDHGGTWQMSNLTFENIILDKTIGASIKSFPDSTGFVSDITFRNIVMKKVNYAIYMSVFFLKSTNTPTPMTFTNIQYSNFSGTTTELVKAPILINCSSVATCTNFDIKTFKVNQAGTRNTPNSIQNACGSGYGLKSCNASNKEKHNRRRKTSKIF